MASSLKSPRVRVLLERDGAPAGEYLELIVQTDNRDAVQWDFVRGRNRWPLGNEAPILWITYLAWNALRRSGGPVPDSFDAFNSECVAIEAVDADGNAITAAADGVDDVDPTRPGVAPG